MKIDHTKHGMKQDGSGSDKPTETDKPTGDPMPEGGSKPTEEPKTDANAQ